MHLLWSLLMLVLNFTLCFPVEGYSQRIARAVGHSEQYIKQIFYAHANCTRTDWACNKECRLEFADRITGLCVRPSPAEICFGIPIRYNFILEAPNIISSLPKYEVLSKFPRCWSALGPLLCAVAYRPCSNRTYFEVSMNEPGKMELWQVFRRDMCHRAVEMCDFLLENSLWPEFVNCSDTVEKKHGRRIFSDGSCKMAYNKEPATMRRKQCLWPMTDGEGYSRTMSRPLIDDCYLPCRSPLISSQWLHDGFRMLIFCFSLIIVVGGLLCTLYLSTFSLLFVKDFCIYLFTHAVLSATVHWFIWLLSYFDKLAERAMCFNKMRRDEAVVRGLLDWCSIQSWILHTSIFSGFFWLLAALAIQIGQPNIRSNQTIKWNAYCNLNLRCFFLICYLLAGLIATVGLWTDAVEVDGVTGVCFLGLRTYGSAMQLFIPVLFGYVLCLLTGLYLRRRSEDGSILKVHDSREGKKRQTEEKDQIALVEDQSDRVKSFDQNDETNGGYSQMSPFWLFLFCGISLLSFLAMIFVYYHLIVGADSERKIVLDSVRCSLNKTIVEGQLEWLHGIDRDAHVDVFSRRSFIGSRSLSATGCELPTSMDDRLLPVFLVFVFLPSLPFLTVMLYVLAGFCGYGLIGVEEIRDKLNPFVLISYSEVMDSDKRQHQSDSVLISGISGVSSDKTSNSSDISLKMSESEQHFEKCGQQLEGRDSVASEKSKIRRIDFRARSRERRNRHIENGFLISKPSSSAHLINKMSACNPVWPQLQMDMRNAYYSLASNSDTNVNQQKESLLQASTMLSAYQNGLIEGHWRERCANYESQVRALTNNLRIADYEIRRLTGLETLEPASAVAEEDGKRGTFPCSAPLVGPTYLSIFKRDSGDLASASVGNVRNMKHLKREDGNPKVIKSENSEPQEKPCSSSRIAVVKTECFVDESNKNETQQPSSVKPQLFGTTLSALPNDNVDGEGQISGSSSNSDSFCSDEEDSEEERLFNQKVSELKRKQQRSC